MVARQLEPDLMLLFGLPYSEVRSIVLEARRDLGMTVHERWTEQLKMQSVWIYLQRYQDRSLVPRDILLGIAAPVAKALPPSAAQPTGPMNKNADEQSCFIPSGLACLRAFEKSIVDSSVTLMYQPTGEKNELPAAATERTMLNDPPPLEKQFSLAAEQAQLTLGSPDRRRRLSSASSTETTALERSVIVKTQAAGRLPIRPHPSSAFSDPRDSEDQLLATQAGTSRQARHQPRSFGKANVHTQLTELEQIVRSKERGQQHDEPSEAETASTTRDPLRLSPIEDYEKHDFSEEGSIIRIDLNRCAEVDNDEDAKEAKTVSRHEQTDPGQLQDQLEWEFLLELRRSEQLMFDEKQITARQKSHFNDTYPFNPPMLYVEVPTKKMKSKSIYPDTDANQSMSW